MDKLEKLLGKELKRGDFGIGSDGTVTSGKPLTARRIRAIINKIDQQYTDSHSSSPAIDSVSSVRKFQHFYQLMRLSGRLWAV